MKIYILGILCFIFFGCSRLIYTLQDCKETCGSFGVYEYQPSWDGCSQAACTCKSPRLE